MILDAHKQITKQKRNSESVLVTGGAGYIGAHMVRLLLSAGYSVVVFDNLSKGSLRFIPKNVKFIKGDLNQPRQINNIFKLHRFDTVMHFAASIVVPESVLNPLKYYSNNVGGSINLINSMIKNNVKNIIFSSTAAVYGEPTRSPVRESDPTQPENPYGLSKLIVEKILKDVSTAHDLKYVVLRYFNAGGAHSSAEVGQSSKAATHLLANALKVANHKMEYLTIFGDDYKTPDGTCVRDYIHVMDICNAHLLAMRYMQKNDRSEVLNLGSEKGYSVKEVVSVVEKVVGRKIRIKIAGRRKGDPAHVVASAKNAKRILGWKASFGLEDIVSSAWKWELASSQSGSAY